MAVIAPTRCHFLMQCGSADPTNIVCFCLQECTAAAWKRVNWCTSYQSADDSVQKLITHLVRCSHHAATVQHGGASPEDSASPARPTNAVPCLTPSMCFALSAAVARFPMFPLAMLWNTAKVCCWIAKPHTHRLQLINFKFRKPMPPMRLNN